MKINIKDARFRLVALLLCVLFLVSALVPVLSAIKADAADGDITVYFDTSQTPYDSTSKWSASMSSVYYYAYSGSGNTGLVAMTNTGKSGKNGGKLFSATVNKNTYSYIIFSAVSPWSSNKLNQTQNYGLSGVSDKSIFILNGNNYNDGGEVKQGMYVYGTYKESESFSGNSFSVLNMDDTDVTLKFIFTDETRNLETEDWNNDATISTTKTQAFTARHYYSNYIEVPASGVTDKPFQTVDIRLNDTGGTDGLGTPLKKYYFPEGKILGRDFWYGITDFGSTPTVDYGDRTKLCYQTSKLGDLSAMNSELYFEKGFFPEGTPPALTKNGSSVSVESITKNGNAKYKTSSAVTTSAFTALTTKSDTDMSGRIFTVTYNGIQYNIFGPKTAGDNLITVNDNVAVVSGKYTVQSTDNVYNNQKYITVQSDFFDYQYDKVNSYNVNVDGGPYGDQNAGNTNQKGSAKRPYLFINDALSWTSYGETPYPMYLGQFWLPLDSGDTGYDTSQEAYTAATAQNQRPAYNVNGDKYWIKGEQESGFYEFFGFGNKLRNFHWAANLAFRESGQPAGNYKPYDAVVQGLVSNTLKDGTTLMAPNSTTVSIPYFDETWWDNNVYSAQYGDKENLSSTISGTKKSYLETYEELPFPFFEINASDISYKNGYSKDHLLSDDTDQYEGTYYLFDSQKHAIYVNNSGLEIKCNDGSQIVMDNYGAGTNGNNSEKGFFPFNTTADNNSSNLHYGFGVTFSIDFYLTENGTLDGTADGTPITFTFQGDDDVWVFLDDKLILDMGGAHKNAIGEINFRNKQTFIGAARTIDSSNEDDVTVGQNDIQSKTESFSSWDTKYLKTGKHKITMYYLERGMLNSNLYVMFNLPLSLTKYELQADTDFSGVNAGFAAATKYVADYDVFNFAIKNKETENVVGSEYKVPTLTSVTRNDSESGQMRSTALSPPTDLPMVNQQVIDSDYLYLDTSDFSSWENESPKFAVAYLNSGSTKKLKLQFFEYVSTNLYKAPNDNEYSTFVVLRVPPGTYSTQVFTGDDRWAQMENYLNGINNYNNNGKKGYWNRASSDGYDVTLNTSVNNRFKVTGWDGSNTWGENINKTIQVPDTTQTTHNYVGSSGSTYVPMVSDTSTGQGVTYGLKDMFAGGADVTYDTRTVSGTQGVVSLQYGEIATFSKQLNYGSYMIVQQLDTLSAPYNNSRVSSYNDSTGRSSSKYYTTYYKQESGSTDRSLFAGIYKGDDVADIALNHVETMYGTESGGAYIENASIKNYSTNHVMNPQVESDGLHFVFSDPTNAANEYVHLRQVVVNQVKTAKLKISKDFLTTETNTSDFIFHITFSNVFGSTDGDSCVDVSSISYTKYTTGNTTGTSGNLGYVSSGKGSFTLKAGEYIEIEGIPVGTKYYIEEQNGDYSSTYELASNYSINLGSQANPNELDADTIALVYNNRKTGSMQVEKIVYDMGGTNAVLSNSETFTATVTLVKPDGVTSLDSYDIQANGSPITFKTGTTAFDITIVHDTPVTITGLPYGTTYTVTEGDVPAGYSKFDTVTAVSGYYKDSGNNNVTYNTETTHSVSGTDGDVKVFNKLEPIIMPSTGGSGVIFIFPLGILAVALSGAALVIYKRRMELSPSHAAKGRYQRRR